MTEVTGAINRQTTEDCLALAIVITAQEEYTRLEESPDIGGNPIEIAKAIQRSFASLDRLRTSQMPDYTDWDPLLYGTWYQPRQINLAHGILTWAGTKPWRENPFQAGLDTWHIVDFGAGALAVQFAAAIAAADAVERGAPISRIRIDSIDTSPGMMQFGERMWDWFTVLVGVMDPNGALDQALRSIDYETHTSIRSVKRVTDATCYLTAINAVYDRNTRDVKSDLNSLVNKLQPSHFLTSTVEWKGNLLREVSPLGGNSEYDEWTATQNGPIDTSKRFAGNVKYVSEWRRECWRDLEVPEVPLANSDIDYPLIRNMLSNNVIWDYPSLAILAYARRSSDDDLP